MSLLAFIWRLQSEELVYKVSTTWALWIHTLRSLHSASSHFQSRITDCKPLSNPQYPESSIPHQKEYSPLAPKATAQLQRNNHQQTSSYSVPRPSLRSEAPLTRSHQSNTQQSILKMGCTPSRSSVPNDAVQEKGSIVVGCGVDIVRYRAELVFYHMREAERYGSKASISMMTESKEMSEKAKKGGRWGRKRGEEQKIAEGEKKEGVEGDDYFSFNPH